MFHINGQADVTRMIIAMIPARMGSQRLVRKNLRKLDGIPLVTRAVRKCLDSGVFDEVWLNSEHEAFRVIAKDEGISFHKRPEALGSNAATSEQYIAEFLQAHPCDYIFQVHSIAPLLQTKDIRCFVEAMAVSDADVMLSCEEVSIECAVGGKPINFSFSEKTNSQELEPIQRISWSITGWRRSAYLKAFDSDKCATYSGQVDFFPINPMASLVIKTEEDLRAVEALWPLINSAN